MLVSSAVDLFFGLFSGLFDGLAFLGLPYDLINVLGSVLCYGTWIIGADLMALIVGAIVFWWGVKFAIGLVVWLWELLPLT